MQGLVAKHFCDIGKKVTIVEPSNLLKVQTAEKIGTVHFGIVVTTIDQFYLEGVQSDVVILNEYDSIVNDWPYVVN